MLSYTSNSRHTWSRSAGIVQFGQWQQPYGPVFWLAAYGPDVASTKHAGFVVYDAYEPDMTQPAYWFVGEFDLFVCVYERYRASQLLNKACSMWAICGVAQQTSPCLKK